MKEKNSALFATAGSRESPSDAAIFFALPVRTEQKHGTDVLRVVRRLRLQSEYLFKEWENIYPFQESSLDENPRP